MKGFHRTPVLGLAAALLVALTLGLAPAAQAQQQQSMQVSEEKLEAYVAAALEVSAVAQEWQAQMRTAQSQAEAQQVREQANAEITQTIQQAPNMTVPEYGQISQAMQQDRQLYQRAQQIAQRMGAE